MVNSSACWELIELPNASLYSFFTVFYLFLSCENHFDPFPLRENGKEVDLKVGSLTSAESFCNHTRNHTLEQELEES